MQTKTKSATKSTVTVTPNSFGARLKSARSMKALTLLSRDVTRGVRNEKTIRRRKRALNLKIAKLNTKATAGKN